MRPALIQTRLAEHLDYRIAAWVAVWFKTGHGYDQRLLNTKEADMKSAIVTGGAGGIGGAICEVLAEAGYHIGVFDYDGPAAQAFAARLPSAVGLQVDITDEGSVAEAVRRFDRVPDVLVNNAGIAAAGGLRQNVATFLRVLQVNIVGAYIMARALTPEMIKRGSGAIINITSIAGSSVNPANGSYGPSKAGLANLTKAMALEFAPHGIRVNAVAPGMINDGMGVAAASDPQIYAKRISMVPAGYLGNGRDVADVVAFLASDKARYVYGQEIVVDGALTLTALRNAVK
jgi:NAD(P)-dependent dehydrogenase (short-subunit alcohol dehydrogenase family)